MSLIENIFNPISSYHHKRILNYLKKLNIEIIIDVGAHKGEFLETMLNLESVKSFYAFEPQKDIFEILKKKFSDNKKITLYNYAMDKEITKKSLQINKLSMTSTLAKINDKSLYLKFKNFLTNSSSNFVNQYEVQTNTIDEIFKDSFLHFCLISGASIPSNLNLFSFIWTVSPSTIFGIPDISSAIVLEKKIKNKIIIRKYI